MRDEPLLDDRARRGYGGAPEQPGIPRCGKCGRRLADYLTPPARVRCHSCKAVNLFGDVVGNVSTEIVGRVR